MAGLESATIAPQRDERKISRAKLTLLDMTHRDETITLDGHAHVASRVNFQFNKPLTRLELAGLKALIENAVL